MPGRGMKIPLASRHGQKKKKKLKTSHIELGLPEWPYFNLITYSKTPYPNTVAFYGTRGYDLNIRILGGCNSAHGVFQIALAVKNPPANAGDERDSCLITGQEDPLEQEVATQSSILAWRIPMTEEPDGL